MATKKIVIVGRDADAWITALFLKSSLGKLGANIEIELLELNSNLTAHDFYSVLPSYKNLHNALGASEKKLTKMAQAHYFVGQQFTGWNADGKEYIHAYDDLGVNFKGIDFYQYWHKAQINGFKVPLEDFCFGAAAAKYGSFEYDLQKSENIPLVYGYHLAATPYLSEVARAALSLGVKHHQGSIKQVNIDNDRIISIETTAGDIFQSDIFIDASGADALLINQLSHSQREDWSHWFRCDKVVTASGPALNPNPSFSRITAFSSGWYGLFPLKNRMGIEIYYSSKHCTQAEVFAEVSSLCGFAIEGYIERENLCGMTPEPWLGNCIAVGDAAANLESLDASKLQPLVVSLVLLRELIPHQDNYALEAKTYNRKIRPFIENLRNFQLTHYLLNSRIGDAFWDGCRKQPPPASLAEKIRLFELTGYVSIREFETFQEENWITLFNGHGIKPQGYHPLVDEIPEQDLMNQFVHLLKKVKHRVEALQK